MTPPEQTVLGPVSTGCSIVPHAAQALDQVGGLIEALGTHRASQNLEIRSGKAFWNLVCICPNRSRNVRRAVQTEAARDAARVQSEAADGDAQARRS